MINFPQFERLTVRNYGLYPGEGTTEGLDLKFTSGPWLILGVNGLGKSTLLLLLRFVLTGPLRSRSAGFAGERSSDVLLADPRMFAVRVGDEARDGIALIEVRFGETLLRVERRLSNLSLVRASSTTGDVESELSGEVAYQSKLAELMQLSQFSDVVRILDRVVFFLEDRQQLVWDLAAQFEIFRALLTPQLSAELRRLEGLIVSADSSARNLSAILFKITQRRDKEKEKAENADDTRARISAALAERDRLLTVQNKLVSEHQLAEEDRADHHLRLKRAEHDADTAAQLYEKIKFDVLRAAFAGVRPNEQYVFLRLISERLCLACNQPAEEAAAEMESRRDQGRCVVCGSLRLSRDDVPELSDALRAKSEQAYADLEAARATFNLAEETYRDSDARVTGLVASLNDVRQRIDAADQSVRRLRKLLPAAESAQLAREEDRIAALRHEVQTFRKERDDAEGEINELLSALTSAAEQIRERLEAQFSALATPFFAEQLRLVYAPREARIGQGGRLFSFPAFEVEMTSGATHGEYIRRRAEQVSYSQREYLDIIFRMALLDVLSDVGSSLVVDGPEGSLDAVFAERAGLMFSRFASDSDQNVIIACNIIEGGFIPCALSNFPTTPERKERVVNLIALAAPTAALRALRPEYEEKVESILSEGVRQ